MSNTNTKECENTGKAATEAEIISKAAANAGARQCSYDPASDAYLLKLKQKDGRETQSVNMYVGGRITWFRTYCAEHRLDGRIEEDDIQFMPELGMVVAKARVYMDNELVATGVAGSPFSPGDAAMAGIVVQSVATKAKGRALANAGFSINGIEDASDLVAPDVGAQMPMYMTTGGCLIVNPDNPVDATIVPDETPAPAVQATSKQTPPPLPQRSIQTSKVTPMTLYEAEAFVIPIGGHKGKTVGEVAATNRSALEFFAGPSFKSESKYPQLVQACKIKLAQLV